MEYLQKIIEPVLDVMKKANASHLRELSAALRQHLEAGRVIYGTLENALKINRRERSIKLYNYLEAVDPGARHGVLQDMVEHVNWWCYQTQAIARDESLEYFADGLNYILIGIIKKVGPDNIELKRCAYEAMANIATYLKDNDLNRPTPKLLQRPLNGPSGTGD